MHNRGWRRPGAASAVVLAVAPVCAWAAETPTFAIPAGPLKAAATAFALQGRVSIDLGAAQGCGPSPGFTGRADPDTALKALLRGSGCEARVVAPRAYKILSSAPKPLLQTPAAPDPA